MEKFILFILPVFFTVAFNHSEKMSAEECLQDVTTYYFIRHAEKDTSDPNNRDPELTEEGVKRSENWARVFKEVPFDIIYSTNYNRTRSTAKRVADSQQKEVQIYDASKLNDPEFQQNTKGKTVLVVGHSNTTPAFVNTILKENKYKDIDDKESGSLFIVTVLPDGSKTSKVLYIN